MRIVNPWNSLSDDVVSATSVMSFESRLDKAWKDQPMKYNYRPKEDLRLRLPGSGHRGYFNPASRSLDDDDDDE